MSKKDYNFIELFRKYWFYGIIVVIIVIFIINRELAIWVTLGFLLIIILMYLPSLSFTSKLIKYMKKHKTIEDKAIAKKFARPLDEIKEKMDHLATKQKGKNWLIASMNNRYVFYNGETLEKFKDFYKMGFNEKRIFDNLRKDVKIRTRAEIKAMEDTLINLNRIRKRDIESKTVTVSKKKPEPKKIAVSKKKPEPKKIAVSKKKPPIKRVPVSKKKPEPKKTAVSKNKPPSKEKSKRSPRDK